MCTVKKNTYTVKQNINLKFLNLKFRNKFKIGKKLSGFSSKVYLNIRERMN